MVLLDLKMNFTGSKELTLQGNIVISVGLFGHAGDFEVWENMNEELLLKLKKC